MRQQVRFCQSADGVRLAWAQHGQGSPLVRAATWLTHLEFDWQSPLWRHWLEGLAAGRRVIRYDERGCGLSDREVEDLSLDAWVGDLEAVVDAAGLNRFALLGISHGGPIAIAYAVRHPDRVSHLVLYGSYARGRFRRRLTEEQRQEAELLLSLVRVGWGREDHIFRRVNTSLFVPEASESQMRWFDELQRMSASAEMAYRIRRARWELDVTDRVPRVAVPTLVLHGRGDRIVPFEEGRQLATALPGARFVPLETRNHILLGSEPAWAQFLNEVRAFIRPTTGTVREPIELSKRETEVLELVAQGLSNEEIAGRLVLSVRTVERHLTNAYTKLNLSGKSARAAAAATLSRSRENPTLP